MGHNATDGLEGDLACRFAPVPSRSLFPTLHVRELCQRDTLKICSWVSTAEAVAMVSSDRADSLSPCILRKWVSVAETSLVVARSGSEEPVGFCTLSCRELRRLPADYVELCHLLVDPCARHLFVGQRLSSGAKEIAHLAGYRFLCGRVIPGNRYSVLLARHQRFSEFTGVERWALPGFRWFRFALMGYSSHRSGTQVVRNSE